MNSLNLTGQEVDKDSPTKAEYEAAIYCDSCFDVLESIENQKENLKVQVETRGVIINESKATIGTMKILLDRMKSQYYLSEKNAKKAKRKAWWRGIYTGVGIGVGVTVAVLVSG